MLPGDPLPPSDSDFDQLASVPALSPARQWQIRNRWGSPKAIDYAYAMI